MEDQVVPSVQDLELLMHCIVSSKNRYLHRGGFTPYQLVLGQNPRMPNDALSDDAVSTVGSSDLLETSWDCDTAAADFARGAPIQEYARRELFR
eukprot:1475601-Pyramimonas_sp.AAC.1